jgi:hypothetical protein
VIRFSAVRVRSFSLQHMDVTWELVPHTENVALWEFFVDRSETGIGSWVEIAGPLSDQYYIRDNAVLTASRLRTWFYRIRARKIGEEAEVVSDVAKQQGELDLIGQEIVRNEYVMWREFSGVALWLFKKRTFGQKCPACFSNRLGATISGNCSVCWGTGYSGGYHRPIKLWGEIQGSQSLQAHRTPEDQRLMQGAIFVGPASPEVTIGDLIVDLTNQRWLVTKLGGSQRLMVTVRQEHVLAPVERSQIQHAIPLEIPLEEELRAPRNFFNPQHELSEQEASLGAMRSLFGVRDG